MVRVRVPAKVNLALSVGPLGADGFHELATVFQAVSLYDEVGLTQRGDSDGLRIAVTGTEAAGVPLDAANLAWRAVANIAEAAGVPTNVDLAIVKGIPVAGGMAGGSADAAAAFLAAKTLWDVDVDLAAMAAELGSDVPFALMGGMAVGSGRGDQLVPAMARGHYEWVFAVATEGLSTPSVYGACDRLRVDQNVPAPAIAADLMLALRQGDPGAVGKHLSNDLQPAAISLAPHLAEVLALGEDHGALGSLVSGSGPTCAFLVAGEEQALEVGVALSSSGLCGAVRRAAGPVGGARVVAHG
ncbi:MAG: 4-(cytidine 5'-diphospho)-2-C-methyl-D-erythritol kinase [Actinomycetia bacterium]|nr:4-(cytidine 5'-diphospho)-2-C-methyl-D-erythritol kinase [Actinomycetes bacterium]